METNLMKACMKAISSASSKVFRNNVGKMWTGKSDYIRKADFYPCNAGDVIVRKARRFHAGLCEGSSDIIGWTEKTITPDMVGQKVAIFTAIEVKTRTGRVSEAQKSFIRAAQKAGGIAGIARTPNEAVKLVTG